jgi:2,4-dienoyl-CoA reductase-like NADH-dependent reductase (Old Yellow Enzyme family)
MSSLTQPISFTRGPTWKNRFALAPLTNSQSNVDGTLTDEEYHWLTMRADGGFGLVMTCAAHVQAAGQGFPGQLGTFDDKHLPGLERLAKGIRDRGSVSSVQLHHAGDRSPAELIGGPARAPYGDDAKGIKALSTGEVEQVVADFTAAAVRCERAGFDGIEFHGAHGYLLCQFLRTRNDRTDGWGGDYAGRTRIYREVIAAARAATGPDFQIGLRMSPERFGTQMSEMLQLAGELMAAGSLDYIDMSLWDCFKQPEEASQQGATLIDQFAAVPRGDCRMGVAGKIMSTATAEDCLTHNADFVLIGKGAMLHHDFPKRAVADAAFEAVSFPQTRDYYNAEGLSDGFVDYVARTWPEYVAA